LVKSPNIVLLRTTQLRQFSEILLFPLQDIVLPQALILGYHYIIELKLYLDISQ